MIAIDYYWEKAQEALSKADAQQLLRGCYMSIGFVYRSLANSEAHMQGYLPHMPHRTIR